MDTFLIIVNIMSAVAYAAMAFLSAFAVSRLARHSKDLEQIKLVTFKTIGIVTAEHLKSSAESLNELKCAFRELVESDRFEEAEKVRRLIEESERILMKEVDRFQENFGDDVITLNKVKMQ